MYLSKEMLQLTISAYKKISHCVTGQGGGECFIAHGHVNPLNLTRRPGVEELPLESLRLPSRPLAATLEPPEPTWESDHPQTRRRRRDVEMVVRAESYVDKDGNKHELVNMVSWTGGSILLFVYQLSPGCVLVTSLIGIIFNPLSANCFCNCIFT